MSYTIFPVLGALLGWGMVTLAQRQTFLSNPALAPPYLIVDTNNVAGSNDGQLAADPGWANNGSLLDEGYIFMTAYGDSQPAPVIFDTDGTLIWDGVGLVPPGHTAHSLTVCEYQHSPALCFEVATQGSGYTRGDGVILNSNYILVASVHSGDGKPALDLHEFRVVDQGTRVLATIYEQIPHDLSSAGFPGILWVQQGSFQEIDIASGNVTFQWNSLDYVAVTETYVYAGNPGSNAIAGDGKSNNTAWDYFHINSVDKNADGDYLVSGRHTKALYKISGRDGSVIWRLGGKQSSFSRNYDFNFQHNAVFVSAAANVETISLFDNGVDQDGRYGTPGYEAESTGLVVAVDTSTYQSTVVAQYYTPDHLLATSQGSFQVLPNGNIFLGLGSLPYVYEFTNNASGTGDVIYAAHLAPAHGQNASSYRMEKYPWTGQPAAPPDLFVYAHSCQSPPVFFASWNGATAVKSWRFWVSGSGEEGSFVVAAEVGKVGFETNATVEGGFAGFTYAEAIGGNGGVVLGTSGVVETWVPNVMLAAACSDYSCPMNATEYAVAATVEC